MKTTFMLKKVKMPPLLVLCVIGFKVSVDVILWRFVMEFGPSAKIDMNV
ncbi:hypothetical protein M1N77_02920 [Thermodesulfovibrionales bacterium]|nr:hypothetical protein [Thermodesulfovibrionales bacterium]